MDKVFVADEVAEPWEPAESSAALSIGVYPLRTLPVAYSLTRRFRLGSYPAGMGAMTHAGSSASCGSCSGSPLWR